MTVPQSSPSTPSSDLLPGEEELMPGVYLTRRPGAAAQRGQTQTSTLPKLDDERDVFELGLADDVEAIEEEITHLRTSLTHLLRSNSEIRSYISTSGDTDPELPLAILENDRVIKRRMDRVRKLQEMVGVLERRSKGSVGVVAVPGQVAGTSSAVVGAQADSSTQSGVGETGAPALGSASLPASTPGVAGSVSHEHSGPTAEQAASSTSALNVVAGGQEEEEEEGVYL